MSSGNTGDLVLVCINYGQFRCGWRILGTPYELLVSLANLMRGKAEGSVPRPCRRRLIPSI